MSAFDDTGDVVVTVPQNRWLQWLAEGDLPGDPPEESALWDFFVGERVPTFKPGARCYVIAWGMLRGYAPMVQSPRQGRAIVRGGEAVACTIDGKIQGFQCYRMRWWDRAQEKPFHDWATAGLPAGLRRDVEQLLELRSRGPEMRASLRHWALTGEFRRPSASAGLAARGTR